MSVPAPAAPILQCFTPHKPLPTQKLDILADLEAICFPEHPWDREQLHSHSLHHPIYLLLSPNEHILAYILLSTNQWEIEILRIATHPNHRRNGYAKIILQSVFRDYPSQECFLDVDTTNVSAIRFYEKMGFLLLDKRKAYYQNGSTALIYTKKGNDTWEKKHTSPVPPPV